MRKLERKKLEIDEKIKEDVKSAPFVSITHDGWTSLNTESYFTTTIHFISDTWMLNNAVLGTIQLKGSHTSENIAAEPRATQPKWNFPTPIATTDNAANERKAYEINKWERFGCLGHKINLVVKNSLGVSELGKLLGKARKMVTFFHQSSSITDLFLEKQKVIFSGQSEQEQLIGHKLIIDVVTRWNSTLYMLQRLNEQFPVLMALANDPSLTKHASTTIKNCIFTFEEQTVIENLVSLLDPFEKAATILCADKTPTMHKVLPITTKLLRIIEISEEDIPVVRRVKEKMQEELNRRATSDKITLLGCIMNPFTKNLDFVPDQRESAYSYLREEVFSNFMEVDIKKEKCNDERTCAKDCEPESPNVETELTEEGKRKIASPQIIGQPCKKIKSADTEEWLDDVVCTGQSVINQGSAAEIELQRYLGIKIAEGDQVLSVLEWWKKHECFFPRISKIAKKYLSIPGSSVSSERVFSLCGQIVNKKRCRLSPKNVDLLVSLNKNMAYW